MNSAPGMDPDDVSSSTYIVYMVIMGLATFLAIFLVRPSSIVRDNGEPVIVAKFAGVKAEFLAILSVFCDWRMLLLIPAFFFSNFSYTYQFNDFNGFNFNIRTRSLNSILFWVAQIIGALMIGYLLDRLPMKRPRRAMLGLIVIAALFMATWIGALIMQLRHKWERKVSNSSELIDYEHADSYPGPLSIYAMFGFCDAAFAVYCYWLMGALSNKHDELSRYAGFFKSIQSLGGAVAAPLDLAQTPLLAYLITNWILCGFSIAAMFLVCRTITDTTVDNGEDEEGGNDEEEGMYETDSRCQSLTREGSAGYQQRPSVNHSSSFEENTSTICATSEGEKTACGSRTSGQRSRCWRSNSQGHDFEEKDLEDPAHSGLDSHNSYMSSSTETSTQSKRRSSSVISASSMTDRTTWPSPTLQHPHHQIRRSVSRPTRAPLMAEIQQDASYLTQPSQHLTVPSPQGSSRIPSISIMADDAPSSRFGIEPSTASQLAGTAFTFTITQESLPSIPPYPLQSQHDPYLYSSWATSPPPQAGAHPVGPPPTGISSTLPELNGHLQPHEYLNTSVGLAPAIATRVSFGGASSSGSTRYDEEQDMDSVDTCSLTSMSSGHDSIPEMSDMSPIPEPRQS
ncbi:hypothetical protein BGZ54_007320 [Gamsiella multidivaricata]|nr:hypothetical protein BGZ54_007320 [Gamsiella multidivaricata]